jgi:hypothetical protein
MSCAKRRPAYTERSEMRLTTLRHLLVPFLFILCSAIPASAGPISLIVPQEITVNTASDTREFTLLAAYVVADDEPFDFPQRPTSGFVPSIVDAHLHTDTPEVFGAYRFLLFPGRPGLAAHQATGVFGPIHPVYGALFAPGETVEPGSVTGILPILIFDWPLRVEYSGDTRLTVIYDFQRDAPRDRLAFFVDLNFVHEPGGVGLTLNSAQRVEVRRVPVPSTIALAVVGCIGVGLRHRLHSPVRRPAMPDWKPSDDAEA